MTSITPFDLFLVLGAAIAVILIAGIAEAIVAILIAGIAGAHFETRISCRHCGSRHHKSSACVQAEQQKGAEHD